MLGEAIIIASREDVERAAYGTAWSRLSADSDLTPDEKAQAPRLLREIIAALIERGETDAEAAASEALGRLRQQEQILRSQARVGHAVGHASPWYRPETA